MYAVLLIAVAGWSSVTVLNDPPNTVFDVTLARADQVGGAPVHEGNAAEPAKPVQFAGIWVGVFGRPYRLQVKGYLTQMLKRLFDRWRIHQPAKGPSGDALDPAAPAAGSIGRDGVPMTPPTSFSRKRKST